jgi:hypothetical protein
MRDPGSIARRGLPAEVIAVGLLFAALGVEIFVTYARLPAAELYHVSGSGFAGGASRVLVFLNFPIALVAIPVLLLLAERARDRVSVAIAVVGIVLCLPVFWPGVVDAADLDAKTVNAVAAVGVAITLAMAIAAARRGREHLTWRGRSDVARIVVAAVVLLLAVPWLAADLGFSFNGVPVLGTLYQSGELRSQPGNPELHRAVHHGHHHGMDGVLLVLSALLLSRVVSSVRSGAVRTAVTAYLSLMLAYGAAEVANDFWLEQVVKRSWTDWAIPDTTVPRLSIAWGVIVLSAAVLFAVAEYRARPPRRPRSVGALGPSAAPRTAARTAHGPGPAAPSSGSRGGRRSPRR